MLEGELVSVGKDKYMKIFEGNVSSIRDHSHIGKSDGSWEKEWEFSLPPHITPLIIELGQERSLILLLEKVSTFNEEKVNSKNYLNTRGILRKINFVNGCK